MSGLSALLANDQMMQKVAVHVAVPEVLLNTFGAGLVLGCASYLLDASVAKKSPIGGADPVARMVNASNQLIMCVGVGGMMLLIEQNLVRAVVLFAAMALVRFRVRVSEKSLSASFFFSVIAGMATGMGEIELAWIFTSVFMGLSLILSAIFLKLLPNAVSAVTEIAILPKTENVP